MELRTNGRLVCPYCFHTIHLPDPPPDIDFYESEINWSDTVVWQI